MKLTDKLLVLGLKNRLIWDITFEDDGTGAGAVSDAVAVELEVAGREW